MNLKKLISTQYIKILILFFNISCAHILENGNLSIKTSPDSAQILIKNNQDNSEKLIGTTPLNIKLNNLINTNTQYLQIIIKKDNFIPQQVIIPKKFFNENHEINISLTQNNSSENTTNIREQLQKISTDVAAIQFLIQKKELDLALNKVKELINQYPYISTFYDFAGNIYYLKKDLNKALFFYKKSLEIYPYNQDTSNIVQKIQNMGITQSGG